MAGSVIISEDNIRTASSRFFLGIMGMIREEYVKAGIGRTEIDEQFSPIDEGFEYISLDGAPAFHRFIVTLKNVRDSVAIAASDDDGKQSVAALDELLAQLKVDPRHSVEDG